MTIRSTAVLTAAATLLLILAGGFVTTTRTGDTIPGWPKSWGRMEAGWPVEWTHRAVAGVVILLAAVLAVRFRLGEPRPWVRRLAYLALAAVTVQALLGGLRVHQYWPEAVAIIHATFAQVVFCIMVSLALFVSDAWRRAGPDPRAAEARSLGAAATLLAFVQLVAGAVTRHTGAGLAVHVGNAILVFLAASLFASRLVLTPLRQGALLLVGLLGAQIVLGLVTLAITQGAFVRSIQAPPAQVVLVTAHVALGAAVLAATLLLALRCHRAAPGRAGP